MTESITQREGVTGSLASILALRSSDNLGDRGRLATNRELLQVAGFWVATRWSLLLLAVATGWLFQVDDDVPPGDYATGVLARMATADSYFYRDIAREGYFASGTCCEQAFFPGYPLLMRWLAPFTGGELWAGVLISWVASTVAAVLLYQLVLQYTGRRRMASAAVLTLAVTPYGVFFTAVFTESLFLALSLGAWLAAQRNRWWLAGLLAAGAASVRVTGLFVAAGLAVHYAQRAWRERRVGAEVFALALPAIPVLAFVGYLHAHTGSWTTWSQAQREGWGRSTAGPLQGLRGALYGIGTADQPDLLLARSADLLFLALGVLVLVVLIRARWWPEVSYLGLSLAVLICSTTIQSTSRYALAWFPGYVVLAVLIGAENGPGRRGRLSVLLGLGLFCLAWLATNVVAVVGHRWVG